MSLPAYMWIKDDTGQDVKGGSLVDGRQGSSEVLRIDHQVRLPYDHDSGSITATRKHTPFGVLKSIDQSSPILFKACCSGRKLSEVLIRLYRINAKGAEEAYYEYNLKNVRVVSYSPINSAIGISNRDLDHIAFSYQIIEQNYLDGHYSEQDNWLLKS